MNYFISLLTILTIGLSQDGRFNGLVFYNYTYDLTENAANDDGFGLNRVFLTYTHELSKGITYKFQTDIDPSASPKEVYLKNAKVDWNSPIGKLTIGLQGMNVFNVTEKTWGFRFLEKSPMDKHKFSSSADMGIGYSGKLSVISYNLMITNGTGYKINELDKYKKISTQCVYGEKKLIKSDGYNVGLVYTMEPYEIAPDTTKNATVVGFFGGYSGKGLRVGGEFDMKKYYDKLFSGIEEVNEQIMAVYASYKITKTLAGLVYYDMYDPDMDTEDDDSTYIILGLNYYLGKGLIITPNIRFQESITLAMINFQFKF